MSPKRSSPAGDYARFVAWAVVLAVVVAGAGYFPTRRLAGPEGVPAMFAGCGVSLFASLIGAIPVALASTSPTGAVGKAALASMLIRFMVVLAAGLSLALSGWLPRGPLLIWIAISYLALLVPDTRYTVNASNMTETSDK